MKRLAVLVLFLVIFAAVLPAYCQEGVIDVGDELAVPLTISGEVVSVDIGKAAVVVKQVVDIETDVSENVNVQLVPETVITKDGSVIKLADLKVGDIITAEYALNEAGISNVASIIVE